MIGAIELFKFLESVWKLDEFYGHVDLHIHIIVDFQKNTFLHSIFKFVIIVNLHKVKEKMDAKR